MLTREENDLLTQTGPGTPMGAMLRRYWLPMLLSEELPEPDGAPRRVQLLGERLVAFRDGDGHVGLMGEACPHRGASLAYARNEDFGLRCIYHGWKVDALGNVVDTPCEPATSRFKGKIRHPAYPTHEAGGVVWAYLGPDDCQPAYPRFEWMGLPESHRFIVKLYEQCNYLQTLEGTLDPAHPSFLHRELPTDDLGRRVLGNGASYSSEREAFAAQMYQTSLEGAPRIICEDTPYGFHAAALRHLGDVQYVRITEFVLPFHSAIARGPHEMRDYRTVVPIDDQACWAWYIHYDPEKPIDHEHALDAWGHRVGPDGRSPANRQNMHLQDRERMRAGSFSGIPGVAIQDLAVQESQGPIYDRATERLGSSDAALIRLRRVLLQGVRAVQAGQAPPGLDPSVSTERLHAVAIRIPADRPWQDAPRFFDDAVAVPRA